MVVCLRVLKVKVLDVMFSTYYLCRSREIRAHMCRALGNITLLDIAVPKLPLYDIKLIYMAGGEKATPTQ